MKYDIQVIECERAAAELTFNNHAHQGWQLVSCWPEEDKIVGVFQRPLSDDAEKPTPPIAIPDIAASKRPAIVSPTASLPTLDEIVALTVAAPVRRGTSCHVLPVGTLATSSSQTEEDLLAALRALGLTTTHIAHRGHRIWLYKGKSTWFINAEKEPTGGSKADPPIGL